MAAKIISVSADDVTYYTLPGSSGELNKQAGALEDTIFGQTYKSQQPGVVGWGVTADAVFKGYPGYSCVINKMGTSTTMTTEACSLVSGKTYQITAATKRVIDRSQALNVFDNGVNQNANVLNVDYLTGKVTFKSTYTVTGPVTVTGKYFPMVSLGAYTSFTLTQSVSIIKDSNIPALQANGGVDTHRPGGLREVSLQLPSVFAAADAWDTALTTRAEYIIDLNPDGLGANGSVARGFFKLFDDKINGNVGALEEENLQFNLYVPVAVAGVGAGFDVAAPFSWVHNASSPIPTAVKTCLDAFQNETRIYVKYLHDGAAGWKGQGVISNMSLQGGIESVSKFSVTIMGDGARTAI